MPIYLDEKTKKYYTSFHYTDFQGNKKRKLKRGFKFARDAKQYEADFLAKLSQTPDMKFSVLVDLYLEDAAPRLKPTTMARKKVIIYKHLIPFFKELPINEITPAHVRKWQTKLLNTDYSNYFRQAIQVELSTLFTYAMRFHKLAQNPMSLCGYLKMKHKPKIDYYTLDQFNTLIGTMADDNMTNKLAFTVLFYSGLRKGELLALTPSDVDFENHTITVNKTYSKLNKKDVITSPKTERSNRTIAIPQKLCDDIKEYLNSFHGDQPQRIFELTNTSSLSRSLDKASIKANLKKIRVHDLRHSHASLLINMGVQPIVIRDRLGHADIKVTLNTYSHLYPDTMDKINDELNKLYEKGIK